MPAINQFDSTVFSGTSDPNGGWFQGYFGYTYLNTTTGIMWIPTSETLPTWKALVNYTDLSNKPTLSTVATSGSYADLSNKPTIPVAQVNSDWSSTSGLSQILNKPTLSTVATSGSYADLSNKPTIPVAQVNSDWSSTSGLSQILNKPTLSTVATSGSYADLSNKPTIPVAQVNSDWNSTSGLSQILNKPTLSTVITGITVNNNCFRVYKNATVASGIATFYLTNDGTATGTALFTNLFTDSIQIMVNDATASYQMSWVLSNSNKTLTVTANKLTTANILTGILGQAQANGAILKLIAEGN